MMRVIRADAAGACYGVQRALDLAYRASEDNHRVQSLGPLIHNPLVVSELAQRGVRVVDEAKDIHGGTVIIRSHGVIPSEKRLLEERATEVIDATCPYVLRAQNAAKALAEQYGAVVVIGDPVHPEVEAICAYAQEAGGAVWVVDSAGRIPDDLPATLGIVVQTTQNRAVFEQIIGVLQTRGICLHVKDTICSATSQRQNAAKELAAQVDAMVVIGGHNSSNTTRLYEICEAICPRTYHIETLEELEPVGFDGCEVIGITAGASTPENQIAPVQEYLERL